MAAAWSTTTGNWTGATLWIRGQTALLLSIQSATPWPRAYHRRGHRAFFCWAKEWAREPVPAQVLNQQVPTDAERAGDFSDICPGPDCPIDRETGQSFPNDRLPVDPNAQAMLVLFPHANRGSGAQSFFQ